MPRLRTSDKGIDLIKRRESLKLRVYEDAGKLAVGYGHQVTKADNLKLGDKITNEQAEAFLKEDIARMETAIKDLVKTRLKQHEFDALVSFVFNIGRGNFAKSTALKRLNAGDKAGVPDAMKMWVKAGGKVLRGLVTRRSNEAKQFQGEVVVL